MVAFATMWKQLGGSAFIFVLLACVGCSQTSPSTTAQPEPQSTPATVRYVDAGVEQLNSAKNVEEKIKVWQSLVTAELAEKVKRDVSTLSTEQRELLTHVLAAMDNPRLVAGFIKNNKATLRFSETIQGEKASRVVNMHREGEHWKVSKVKTRIEYDEVVC